jgi:hypothetical protein
MEPVSEGRIKAGNPTLSWLVRCWEEPRERSQEGPVLRGFVRDLKTGEERYLSDPRELGEMVNREMKGMGVAAEDEHENPGTGG